MTPILYSANATNFDNFGLGVLSETTSCEVTEERNGIYELVMKYPFKGIFYNFISIDSIIKAKANDTSADQLFRIYKISTPINGLVTIYAQHISYDLCSIGIKPFSLTNVGPMVLMTKVLNEAVLTNNFSFSTNISIGHDFSLTSPTTIRNCICGKDMSLLALWDGEIEWDNFVIKFNSARGNDTGVVIEYGKNLTKLEHVSDSTEIYTDLFPYALNKDENGNKVAVLLTEKIIAVPTTLTNRKTFIKDFTDCFEDGVTITEQDLRTVANQYIADNPFGIGVPSITFSFEPLWKQKEYYSLFERVSLCDLVTVKHSELGIVAKAKVIKTVYDSLAEKFKTISIGTAKANLTTEIQKIETTSSEVKEEIDRFPSVMKAAIDKATKDITGNSGGYVSLHADENGKPYEFLIMDQNSISTATKVWRWNLNGLAYSGNGYSGPYTAAMTSAGEIVADFITSGSLTANIIKAGTISSLDGTSYWNVTSGEISITGSITTQSGSIGGFTIDSNSISHGTWGTADSVLVCSGTTGSKSIGGSASIAGWAFTAGSAFGVTKDGDLYANNVHLTGDIQATSGSIDIGNGSFVVDNAGNLTATSADIEGSIVATGNNSSININNKFIVTTDGIMTAKNANISGNMEVTDLAATNVDVEKIIINGLRIAADNSGSTQTQTATFSVSWNVIYGSGVAEIVTTFSSDVRLWEQVSLHAILKGVRWDDEKARQMYYTKTVQASMAAGSNSVVVRTTVYDDTIVIRQCISIVPDTITFTRTTSYPGFMFEGHVVPYWNGSYDLGNPLKKWDDIYANNTAIQTSDRKSKYSINYDISKYDGLFDLLKPASFKYKDGDSGRTHLGFVAQDIEQSLIESEISSNDFACLIKSLLNEDEPNPTDEDYLYGLRLGELHALQIRQIQLLKGEIAELKKEIQNLKEVKDG